MTIKGVSFHPSPGGQFSAVVDTAVSEFDEQFLHRHAMAWSADHRPN
jgi:hypothetical protein